MIRMLIVDDEEQIRQGIKTCIDWETHGISVCGVASNATEALDIIDEVSPHVIITDIKMSDMDGLQLLEIINEKHANIKVILISGYRNFDYAQKAVSLNAFCYLVKPVRSQELLAKALEAKTAIEDQIQRIEQNQHIQKLLNENKSILKENFFLSIVKGDLNENIIGMRHEFLKNNAEGLQWSVCILKPDSSDGLFKAAIMNETESLLKKEFDCYIFNLQSDIGLLVCAEEINEKRLKDICFLLRDWVNASLGLSLTIGIGGIYEGINRIKHSHEEAIEALQYMLVAGKNTVIDYNITFEPSDNAKISNELDNRIKGLENDVLFLLKSGDVKGVDTIIDDLMAVFQKVIEENISQKNHQILLLAFFLTKMIITLDMRVHAYFGKERDLYDTLCNLQTIFEMKEFVRKFFADIFVELDSRKKRQNSFLVGRAIEFINSNIDKDLSLVRVADHLMIHPNYLSKIFKQAKGQSFIEYVTEKKMNEAKLLLQKSNDKVYKIAQFLHYHDVGHFARLFKKSYGVSPTEYRQML